MIYITGDCHGDYRRFNKEIFSEQREMTKDDYVIICGDFGYWDQSNEQQYWLKWLDNKSYTTLWIDGNHENYDLLSECEISEWKGGKVNFICPSVIHLMRGQVFELEGKRFFTFGGAQSHDIQGGILEKTDPDFAKKRRILDQQWMPYRINHFSWWKEEMPCPEEYQEGIQNLEKVNWNVDYIITHCCASSTQATISAGDFEPDELTTYLEMVHSKCDYRKWFFGHYHGNKAVNDKEILLYEQIIRIA